MLFNNNKKKTLSRDSEIVNHLPAQFDLLLSLYEGYDDIKTSLNSLKEEAKYLIASTDNEVLKLDERLNDKIIGLINHSKKALDIDKAINELKEIDFALKERKANFKA